VLNYGKDALLLEWEQRIDPEINRSVHAYAEAARAHPKVLESVPAYCSLLLQFDSQKITTYQLREWIYDLKLSLPNGQKGTHHKFPVVYGGDHGPDLAELCLLLGLSENKIIKLHTSVTYSVYQLGYLPGFAFLGQTDERLKVARRKNPRKNLAAGSVGLAGRQTAIYPHDAPGGWQIIGWSPVNLWDASRKEVNRLKPGDTVSFYATSEKSIAKEVKKVNAQWTI
jgi:inhibitor of KinA